MYEVEIMSYFEYEARMHAFRLKEIDKEYDMHLSAWLQQQVSSTNKNGKPAYKKFKEFFDYEKKIKEAESGINATNIKPQHQRMANVAAEVNARGG